MLVATPLVPQSTARSVDVAAFIRDVAYADLPSDVVAQSQRCLLDLIGVAAAGSRTPAAKIVNAYAVAQMGGRDREARILFDGRRAGLAGAAFAGATTIDALDAHDGHVLTKGHAGVAVLPALLAYLDGGIGAPSRINGEIGAASRVDAPIDGLTRIDAREFLTCIALGYEIGTRAGMALHASVADYHCSGAWNALACAAIGGRLLEFDDERMRHALGIAEYFGPRGQILRVCDSPTMLKDGSGWGAQVGVSAALLAHDGFTGAPALTVERDDARAFWSDLGQRWRIREQYFKAYPVCRWAQPAVEAVLALQRAHAFDDAKVVSVDIQSFRAAIDLGSQCRYPATTDEAQYSLPYAVAAVLVHRQLGADEVDAAALADPRITRLLEAMTLTEDVGFSGRFPAERWARVRIALRDGRTLVSESARARGNPENPLPDDELRGKYRALAEPVLGHARTALVETLVDALPEDVAALPALVEELLSPIG